MIGFFWGDHGGRSGEQMLLAVALSLLFTGCAETPKLSPAPPVTAVPAHEQITARIEELESRLGKDKMADPEGALAYELALLYVHPANRTPDYGKSLAMMRTYLSLAPPGKDDLETIRLTVLLLEIERLGLLLRDSKIQEKVLSSQMRALQHGERNAKKREQELHAQIKLLQEQMEKIRALDMEIENRRRSVR